MTPLGLGASGVGVFLERCRLYEAPRPAFQEMTCKFVGHQASKIVWRCLTVSWHVARLANAS